MEEGVMEKVTIEVGLAGCIGVRSAGKTIPGGGTVGAKAQRQEGVRHAWELVKTMGITNEWGAEGGQWKKVGGGP